jgi:hypothetical protein
MDDGKSYDVDGQPARYKRSSEEKGKPLVAHDGSRGIKEEWGYTDPETGEESHLITKDGVNAEYVRDGERVVVDFRRRDPYEVYVSPENTRLSHQRKKPREQRGDADRAEREARRASAAAAKRDLVTRTERIANLERVVAQRQESLNNARAALSRAEDRFYEINSRPGPRFQEIMSRQQTARASASERRHQCINNVAAREAKVREAEGWLAEARSGH